jgi:hypothetical protein
MPQRFGPLYDWSENRLSHFCSKLFRNGPAGVFVAAVSGEVKTH